MPTHLKVHGHTAAEIHATIRLLIDNLINIKDTTGEFLMPLADGRIIDTKGWNDWEWTHGVGLYGLWKYHLLTSSSLSLPSTSSPQTTTTAANTTTTTTTPSPQPPSPLQIMTDWFTARLAESTTKNINTMSPLLTLTYLYSTSPSPNPSYLPWLESWGSWAYSDLPRTPYSGFQHITYLEENKNQLWADTLMMTVLPLAKMGLVLGRGKWVEEAKRQILLHIRYLADPKTGLWYHGWVFDDEGAKEGGGGGSGVGHNFAGAKWARGNAWITIVIPEFIELLDLREGDGFRMFLTDVFVAQVRALKACQREGSGMWGTLLDVSEAEGSYDEASATAGFAYGILKGIRMKLISREEFEGTALRAVEAVLGDISPEGELVHTSFGTGMGWDLKHYKDIPITAMPYGQAMAIMMLGEFLQVFI